MGPEKRDARTAPALFGPLARHVHHARGATTATILGHTVHLIGAADTRAEGRLRGFYDMWDEGAHVVDALPDMRRYWLGVDYGTTNPFAALLLGEGVDGRLYVCSEWRHDSRATRRQMTDAQYSAAVRQWLAEWRHPAAGPDVPAGVAPQWTFIDPSAAFHCADVGRRAPGPARASNEVKDGIRTVAGALAAGRLLVHRSCSGLLAELPGYSWDAKATERGEDAPLKIDDHSADALRYVMHSTAHEWRQLLAPAQNA
ncbi:terminase [Streptomyces albiflaviniger]|nr:terminase [Streptomyces albiflaviniger]